MRVYDDWNKCSVVFDYGIYKFLDRWTWKGWRKEGSGICKWVEKGAWERVKMEDIRRV